ncbi:MAG: histidine--tRNA ligase [Campylobacteraceae bacterium 4484_166]|nr:MAG: histidine--tRNA ligase [Campylobacteraceae bacterium 4484_166]
MQTIQSLRGMNDIKEQDGVLFLYFIENCSLIAKRYGFDFISTPILEQTSLFVRSVGNSSDIVTKEMYRFTDKGENDVCLRPEGTASVVRSFIEKKLDKAGGVHRFYYFGPLFRYERPQKGRLRQFHQFGCETIGESSYMEELNMIDMLTKIFQFFKITFKLHINSLGCQECMPSFKRDLVKTLHTIKLCDDCVKRAITNPIRVFDCKNKDCQNKLKNIAKITDSLCEVCQKDFDSLTNMLDNLDIPYTIDKNLVRGLDYYTKTAFEFISADIGSQDAIAGGGRYDKLVSQLGGKDRSGVGFAIGIERLMPLIKIDKQKKDMWYIATTTDEAIQMLGKIVSSKRKSTCVLTDYKKRSWTKHISNATKKGATHLAIIGQDEFQDGTIWTKNLITKDEKIVTIKEFKELN